MLTTGSLTSTKALAACVLLPIDSPCPCSADAAKRKKAVQTRCMMGRWAALSRSSTAAPCFESCLLLILWIYSWLGGYRILKNFYTRKTEIGHSVAPSITNNNAKVDDTASQSSSLLYSKLIRATSELAQRNHQRSFRQRSMTE